MMIRRILDFLIAERDSWRGYTNADIASAQQKMDRGLVGQVVWLSDGELNALHRVRRPPYLGIARTRGDQFEIVHSPHSGKEKGVVLR